MSDSARQTLIIIVLLLVLIGIGVAVGQYSQTLPQPVTDSAILGSSAATPQAITYQGQDGKTVLELLEQSHKVETSDSSSGKFVTSIDGVANTQNAFWFYTIDGQQGLSGVDQAQTQNGQTIEWRYETFNLGLE